MQDRPSYRDVVLKSAISSDRMRAVLLAGVDPDLIVVDPGFGLAKTLEHNLTLLVELPASCNAEDAHHGRSLPERHDRGDYRSPGWATTPRAPVAAAVIAVQQGATVLRVHDVSATRDALALLAATGIDTRTTVSA